MSDPKLHRPIGKDMRAAADADIAPRNNRGRLDGDATAAQLDSEVPRGAATEAESAATDDRVGSNEDGRRLSRKRLVVVTTIGAGGVALLLYRSPELRRVVVEIGRDVEVRKACKAAYDVVVEKWVQYGGPAALTRAILA